jgi:manganese/zinc/iron transport system permease protein
MGADLEIILVAVVAAAACAVPGVFLVLRSTAMLSDAISHAILPGIAIGFFLTHDLNSPLLVIGAALTGLLTVVLVEIVLSTRLVREDAAIGLVFPFLFSIGIILITRYASDIHLDVDVVLLGELAFVPFDRLIIGGVDLGPRAFAMMAGVLILNIAFVGLFFKELKLSTFDAGLAFTLGFAPAVLHYVLMGLVSLTAVAAFDAVGSILVVALFAGPPVTAHLLTDRLKSLMAISVGIGAGSAVIGYLAAAYFDISIAGAIASTVGVIFGLTVLLAPNHGLVAAARRRQKQRWEFAVRMLAIHLLQHHNTPDAERECREAHLSEHLRWDEGFAREVVQRAVEKGFVVRREKLLHLTPEGMIHADRSLVQP